jgi:CheY-like chemotaxis protein
MSLGEKSGIVVSTREKNNLRPALNGSRKPLRALLVEDSKLDAELLARALDRGGFDLTWTRVDTAEHMEQAMQKQPWDLILCDHAMPDFSAPEALALLKRHGLDVPFIIVSGYIEEETAVAAMKAGAHDYVMKDASRGWCRRWSASFVMRRSGAPGPGQKKNSDELTRNWSYELSAGLQLSKTPTKNWRA